MSNLALDIIIKKRDDLLTELGQLQEKYGHEIKDLNRSIKLLGGEAVSPTDVSLIYDDQSPTYITGTEDGI